ncbi:MalY/PatB family protein [Microbacterium sp. MPKO10]|uniref:MalY/PatB family protein n=1 Tax=Microbacterium sp. MPKO10 TaxID=2989818 RepID=UPI0022368501|nr:aminotransferase class I/II-fold pyridoxal phosphate-dependent enzyme [Microbacterium sp. MPKO10]MCW4456836.1 aminotransferase class I/II-fold pyridoxal phosphate-dependent enzyme [Microbacterium sp. MPKO10]
MTSRTHEFDAISIDRLRETGGTKWTAFPEAIGAFVAEMDFGTASEVKQAIHEATDRGMLGYLPRPVADHMAQATATWYGTTYGWEIGADQVHPVADVLKTVDIAIEHYSRPDSPVIIPTPTYMNFIAVSQAHGREIIEVPLAENEGRLEMDLEALERAFHAGGHLLLLCNPYNPVGRVFSREELVAISEVVARNGGRVFADEVHAPLVYDGFQHVPYASVSSDAASHTVTGTSAAKAWNLAGLKCAQFITSNDADAAVWERIANQASHGASTLGVIANTAAYEAGRSWLDSVIAYNARNRFVLAELLEEKIPEVSYTPPEGTFVAWLDCRALGIDGSPAEFFRDNAGVVLTDGAACGSNGVGFVRLIFATPRPILEETVDRMACAVRKNVRV